MITLTFEAWDRFFQDWLGRGFRGHIPGLGRRELGRAHTRRAIHCRDSNHLSCTLSLPGPNCWQADLICPGFGLLLWVYYRIYAYYRTEFQKNNHEGTFFAVVMFMIFVMQVDSFGYFGTSGYVIMALLAARTSLNIKAGEF